MAQKPSIPKGTRDFSPLEMMRRQYIFDKIRDVFRTFGFGPLETPAMENLSTLLGKYGDEGDKLLFKILNSGDYAAGLNDEELRTASRICEKGLRYDLTVPFARYVVQHQSEIAFPFKRYQIQPVWRADRPQKGRYREFYQCDVDVIGTRSLLCEVELIQIVERVFRTLGINVSLKVNNRKILYGIAETIGHADKMIDITVAIDKLEKIGLEAVKAELTERGIGSDAIEKLQPILELTGDNERKLAVLRDVIGASAVGLEGISEMETIFGYVNRLGVELPIELDFSLARGLNYYTGAIFEVKALDFAIGSICGGGRYDDLTGIFGMPNMSGVGISFGADRIYDVMTGLGLFPADLGCAARVMFANLGEAEEHASLKLLQEVRAAGIPAEIYPENGKMKKQMEYANRRGIPCVVIVGSRELEELSTLLGKYGDEGDKLLFKILNSGDYAAGLNDEELRTASRICEKGLRYDLTVPFARYVVQHQSEIAFPFKRYQIQPVWRADRPQKGRYREFYQCDVDVIGTRSLLCEVELIQIVERVFRTLGINVSLKVNNRKILYGIAETIGHADKMIDITVAIDKLEKIGLEAVKAELTERGIGSDAIEKLQPILELTGDNERKLAVLRDVIGASAVGLEGISEMETIFGYVNRLGVELPIELDFSLARGLNYYTGAIFEVKALDFAIGSICGGGRYDDLTGIFGMPNMSGVGISFGADRIYDVMTGLGLFPADLGCAARVMFANLGEAEEHASLKLLQEVRAAGIPAEIYPENGKMKKQMEYANRRGIPCVVIVGSRELEERVATIKDMTSGEQTQVPFTRLAEALR